MPAYSPTMRRRRLAAELRRLRESAGMTQEDVAGQLEWDPSKLSRIENRQVGIIAGEAAQAPGAVWGQRRGPA